jgi:hypothetical protein
MAPLLALLLVVLQVSVSGFRGQVVPLAGHFEGASHHHSQGECHRVLSGRQDDGCDRAECGSQGISGEPSECCPECPRHIHVEVPDAQASTARGDVHGLTAFAVAVAPLAVLFLDAWAPAQTERPLRPPARLGRAAESLGLRSIRLLV